MKQKSTTTTKMISPAEFGLSHLQNELYCLIADAQANGGLITSTILSDKLKKETSWIYRNLTVLIDKGLIERYNGKYYKLKGN